MGLPQALQPRDRHQRQRHPLLQRERLPPARRSATSLQLSRLAVAERGSATSAACLMRVAQPSVSQQIRSLERELGMQLVHPYSSGRVPTVVRAFLRDGRAAMHW
ncbi:LysR family transcriptional regulator [Actinoplanes sp. NPDC089786]|uniref:helix-turn-helix domain-containing protein n=1 Tax=Actinoplanes sp. NPDC089786 TaxID=3155185 RepID=UPI0034167BE3